MEGLPKEKAGIGSAVNDTARELGGTLGVAAMGSLFASLYSRAVASNLSGLSLPPDALAVCKGSIIGAEMVARRASDTFGAFAGDAIRDATSRAFLDGFHAAAWLGAGCLFAGAIVCFWILPALRQDPKLESDRSQLT